MRYRLCALVAALVLPTPASAQYAVLLSDPAYLGCIVAAGKKLPNIPSATIRSILPTASQVKVDGENAAISFRLHVGDQTLSLNYQCKGKPTEMEATLTGIGK